MRVALLLSNLLLGACTVFGVRSGTEEPPYTVSEHLGPIEVRQYGARTAAEITVTDDEVAARSDGFRKLARYIFGSNAAAETNSPRFPNDAKYRFAVSERQFAAWDDSHEFSRQSDPQGSPASGATRFGGEER